MASRVLGRLRAKIRDGEYRVPFHAASELDDDDISAGGAAICVVKLGPTAQVIIITAWVE